MKYPESLLLPILMFADYFLTVFGAVQREKNYSRHFQTQHYELNPKFQKDVAKKKWFNPRHIILTIVLSAIIIVCVESGSTSEEFSRGALGCLLVVYAAILGRHLSNLLIFRYLTRHPNEVSGEVVLSYRYCLSISLYQSLLTFVPVAFVAIFSMDSFAIGGAVGAALFIAVHLAWIHKAKKQTRALG